MTMGASIECRVPFLDPRLVEGLAAAPTAALFGPFPGRGKAPLRGAMAGLLPRSVLAQKKRGFGVPWHRYFREVPALRGQVETVAGSELLEHLPIGRPAAAELCRRFLAGDGSTTSAVRQLVFMAVWWRVCIEGRGAGRPHPAGSDDR
jgi:asparagine synthase (glutamine-hydrolysing)